MQLPGELKFQHYEYQICRINAGSFFFKFAITLISGTTYYLGLKSFEQSVKNVQGAHLSLQGNKILSTRLSKFPVPFMS